MIDLPVYDMPPVYDHSERQVDKVSTLNSFLKSCLELMKDESALSMLHGMIDHCHPRERDTCRTPSS
jgi:hypothetical protein